MARLALVCAFAASASAVEFTSQEQFDKEVFQTGKAAFVKFLAPW
jgi:hypothetical protein